MKFHKLMAATALGMSVIFASAGAAQENGKSGQSMGEYTSDAVITTKVKAAIVADKSLSALDIGVETLNGVVTLTGMVGTAKQTEHAALVARGVKGVKQVVNDLKVDPTKAKK
jgi:hyperosmotically inducible protein